ncbi:unnamed protein product [Nesidiocoris tenuis]|uniref:Uncharacterized protein n=1 Tax=Nesidiocoris tenuis TaxID=355587 RepID=A0A6H5GSR0_9HEMI|nr:unnamed protein product [Nesidiocoris tenuis]
MTTRKPLPNHRWSSPTLTSFSWILEELEEASNLGLMSILATTDLWSERILLPQHPTSRPLVRHQSDSSNHGQQNHHHLHLTLLHHLLQVSRFMEDFHSFLSEKTFLGIISKKKTSAVSGQQTSNSNNDAVSDAPGDDELIYDEMVDLGKEMFESERIVGTSMGGNSGPHAAAQHLNPSSSVEPPSPQPSEESKNVGGDDLPLTSFQEAPLRSSGVRDNSQERFPHGPRNLDVDSLPLGSSLNARKRRSVVVSDRKTRSADVGVSGLYEVISEADLAFTPDSKGEAVTVFQGRIREEVVYGICLPVPGFSALFVLVAVSAVVSALVAGALLYRYQMQRETQELVARQVRMRRQHAMTPQVPAHAPPHVTPQVPHQSTSIASWVALRLLRPRAPPSPTR